MIIGNLRKETTCKPQIDAPSTKACHAQGHSAYPEYSWRPCGVSEGQEVHIINVNQGTGSIVPVRQTQVYNKTIMYLSPGELGSID